MSDERPNSPDDLVRRGDVEAIVKTHLATMKAELVAIATSIEQRAIDAEDQVKAHEQALEKVDVALTIAIEFLNARRVQRARDTLVNLQEALNNE